MKELINYQTYEDVRPYLQDGDIVFFSSHNGIGDKIIKWWQWLIGKSEEERAGSKYSHVGTVMTMGGRVFLLEASFKGGVRMVPMSLRQPDLIVSMNLTWTQEAEDYAMGCLGLGYDLWAAMDAGAGGREDGDGDNRFICTEYVANITDRLGYYLPKTKQLPSNFYEQLERGGFTFRTILNPVHSKIK
jgi:hypothetical protein